MDVKLLELLTQSNLIPHFFFFFFSLKSKNPFGSVIETASLIFAGMTVAILSLLGQSSVEWFYRRSEAFSVSHL